MKETKITGKLMIAGAVIAAAMMAGALGLAITGQTTVASAQELTTTTTDSTTLESATLDSTSSGTKKPKGGASPHMICEAEQRTHARFKKWVEQGIPEEFGSEEPFTYDPSKCSRAGGNNG